MASIINISFFEVDCFIPQLGHLAVQSKVNTYINRYEPRFLTDLLGKTFYDAFTVGLAAPAPEQRWLDLKNGKTYTDTDGNTFVWEGLANATTKISAVANYVYYWYTRSDSAFSTGSGEVVPEVENGTRASFVHKQVQAWNEMVRLNYACLHFLQVNKDVYPEWEGWPGWYADTWLAFFSWWAGHWQWRPATYWWPLRCSRPDIFQTLNVFGW